jgi:hypothetical protein
MVDRFESMVTHVFVQGRCTATSLAWVRASILFMGFPLQLLAAIEVAQ